MDQETDRHVIDDMIRLAITRTEPLVIDQKVIQQVEQMKQRIAAIGVQLTNILQPIASQILELFPVLRRKGYIRVYPPPKLRKSTGRRRSRRELRDIRRQRQRKPYGVWLRDFSGLPVVSGVDHASPEGDQTIITWGKYMSRDGGMTWTCKE